MLLVVALTSVAYVGPSLAVSRAALGSARVVMVGYVPDGLTPEQYKQIKAKEAAKEKNLGKSGTNRFQSRSMYAFQVRLCNCASCGRAATDC